MNQQNKKNTPLILIELLESFDEKELEGLKKIAACSYFNTDRYVINLLNVLTKKVLNRATIEETGHTEIYNLVFDDQPAAKTTLNKKQKALFNAKMSVLNRLAERFLTIEALEDSNMHKYDLLLNALVDKKLYRHFGKNLRKAEGFSEKEIMEQNRFEFQYIVENSKFRHLYESGLWLKNDNINNAIHILDLYYLSSKMRWTKLALGFSTRKPENNYDLSVVKLFDDRIFKKYMNGEYPYLTLAMASINLSLHKTDHVYYQYMELLEKVENLISRKELIGYYTIALNFCTSMYKKGKLEYMNIRVDILKVLDQKKLFLFGNSIPLQTLKNIVVNGCMVGEFNWVLQMIKKYTHFVNKKYQADVLQYNLGYVAFQQKKYEEAIDHFLDVNNFQNSYDINKRMLILKAYYEVEKHYNEPTAQLFRSIEAFVAKNKQFTNIDKKTFKTTIRIFYNLYRCKHRVGKMTLETLQQKIEQAEYIASKAWLLEKIEALKKRK